MTNTTRHPMTTGSLTLEEINQILIHAGVEFTFVDANDRYQYYNAGSNAIFSRTPDIIGTHLLDCHPEETHGRVMEMMDDLKSGRKDEVAFVHEKKDRIIHESYIALRTAEGDYLGCLERVSATPKA